MLNFRYYVINFCCSMTNIIIANLRKFYFITLLVDVLLPNHNSNHTALNTYSVNSNQTSLTNHYVPSAVPRNWNLLTSIILTKTLLSRFFYYFHFTRGTEWLGNLPEVTQLVRTSIWIQVERIGFLDHHTILGPNTMFLTTALSYLGAIWI